MGFIASLLIVYGVAGVALGGAVAVAIGLCLHHRRRSRVAAYARSPSASPAAMREGFALLRGEVAADDAAPDDAVIAVEIPYCGEASPGAALGPWQTRARAFSLRLASGAAVRVVPASGKLSLDTTFVPTSRGGMPVYVSEVRPGDAIYIAGAVRRELDPSAAGKGYRDAAQAWVLRAPAQGNLCVSSETVIAHHARRARFHRAWALALGGALAALHLVLFRPFHASVFGALGPAGDIGVGPAALALFLVGAAALAYRTLAEQTSPWTELRVERPRTA
ncbi:hypothetical protein SOCE26_080180 [Sorangium cellulosum]|uniref:Uncharacterized protein n=1 Tax=Sorangium cellulosum TaxID=56 RepID=A0A2L0F4N1_SORCE|nr:hypothetical protein [Sorangium cellulosum]AUX46512.1 hypothetical protein SOCE26_080180 [Sorangium cellulosum]